MHAFMGANMGGALKQACREGLSVWLSGHGCSAPRMRHPSAVLAVGFRQ